jgi:hypothetical protein
LAFFVSQQGRAADSFSARPFLLPHKKQKYRAFKNRMLGEKDIENLELAAPC